MTRKNFPSRVNVRRISALERLKSSRRKVVVNSYDCAVTKIHKMAKLHRLDTIVNNTEARITHLNS